MGRTAHIRIKRAYEVATPADGYRILVDRLWPRGLAKQGAELDEWIKDVAPSAELRRWYGHEPTRFPEFATRYRAELEGSAAFAQLCERCRQRAVVTLVYSARDRTHNQAVVLRDLLTR